MTDDARRLVRLVLVLAILGVLALVGDTLMGTIRQRLGV